jgi:hypothetical protein
MSSLAKQAREAMKAKASRLTTADPHQKVDSSTWTPAEPLNTEVKTGMRPVSRRAFKSGGKVTGKKAKANLGKKPRNSGGKAITADSLINRNAKEANEERPGGKAHIGGYKKGGRLKRNTGGTDEIKKFLEENPDPKPEPVPLPPPRPKNLTPVKPERFKDPYDLTTQGAKRGGRAAKCWGGKSKKATGGATDAAQQMMAQAQKTAGVPASGIYGAGFSRTGAGSLSPAGALGKSKLKKGGMVHEDVKADKALIKKMVKPSAMKRKGRDDGGRNYEDAPDYANRSFAFQKESGPRQNQVSEWFKNKELPDVKNMSALERAGTIAKLAGKTLLEGPVRTGAYLMDQAGLKRGGKAKRKGRADGGGNGENLAMQKLRNIARDTDPRDNLGLRSDLNYGDRTKYDSMTFDPDGGELPGAWVKPKIKMLKKGGRTARKEGGGVFSGTSYPGKIPGVVPGGRTARATGGKTKGKGKTNINIVIAPGKSGMGGMMPPGGPTPPPGMDGRPGGIAPVPMAPPPGEGPGAAPMPMPIPMPMPMAGGAPAGGPPPVGRKSGGRLKKYIGGSSSSDQDYPGNFAYPEEEDQPQVQYRNPTDAEVKEYMDRSVRDIANKMNLGRKSGGRLTKVAHSYKDMEAGSAGGEGRLQKTDIAAYKRFKHKAGGKVYKSYKDMDAGSGSGLGRLEKTEIQKRKG